MYVLVYKAMTKQRDCKGVKRDVSTDTDASTFVLAVIEFRTVVFLIAVMHCSTRWSRCLLRWAPRLEKPIPPSQRRWNKNSREMGGMCDTLLPCFQFSTKQSIIDCLLFANAMGPIPVICSATDFRAPSFGLPTSDLEVLSHVDLMSWSFRLSVARESLR